MADFAISLCFGSIFGLVAFYLGMRIKEDIPTIKVDPWWCAAAGFAFGWLGLLGSLFYILYRVVQAQRLNK